MHAHTRLCVLSLTLRCVHCDAQTTHEAFNHPSLTAHQALAKADRPAAPQRQATSTDLSAQLAANRNQHTLELCAREELTSAKLELRMARKELQQLKEAGPEMDQVTLTGATVALKSAARGFSCGRN